MDKLIQQHLKEWKSYKSQLEKDMKTANDFWSGVYEYRIRSLNGLIMEYEE